MSAKIFLVAILALALAPGAAQAKPNASKGKGKAPQAAVEENDGGGAEDDADWLARVDLGLLDPADVKPPTELDPRPPSETIPDPPPPPASPAPGKGKGYGRACRGQSRRKAPGQRQSPFKRCIEARKDAEASRGRAPVAEQEPDGVDGED